MEADRVPIEVLPTVTSTMDIARENLFSGRIVLAPGEERASCAGVMAYEQTAGRGQRGRSWYARLGESLCVTYSLRSAWTDPEHAAAIALLAGAVVASQLRRLATCPAPQLKWPNDILLNGRKAGGILIEMVKASDGGWVALIGVGLNVFVREFPPEAGPIATSLVLEGVDPREIPELPVLAQAIGEDLVVEASGQGAFAPARIIADWRRYDGTVGRRYETEWSGAMVAGTAAGIDDTGALLLRLDSGEEIAVTSASALREIITTDTL